MSLWTVMAKGGEVYYCVFTGIHRAVWAPAPRIKERRQPTARTAWLAVDYTPRMRKSSGDETSYFARSVPVLLRGGAALFMGLVLLRHRKGRGLRKGDEVKEPLAIPSRDTQSH